MYEACSALRDCMLLLGVGIDGGKDSLTMAAKVCSFTNEVVMLAVNHVNLPIQLKLRDPSDTVNYPALTLLLGYTFKYYHRTHTAYVVQVGEEVVKCPGQVVLTCYAPCTDIAHTLTPDFKHPGTYFTVLLL